MIIKLYFGNQNTIKKSGIGSALVHQRKALELNNIEYTDKNNDYNYDILHINNTFPSSIFEIIKAKKANKKIIYHAHSTEEDFRGSFYCSNVFASFYKRWLVFLYKQADLIITPTPYSKRLLENYGLNKEIYAISNGISLEDYNPTAQQIKCFEDYFHIQNEKVIISVGWLFERKGFDTFVEVAQTLPEYKFIWFGDINLSLPTIKIRKILRHLPDNVILPGYVDGDLIKGAYGRADVFFFPSREETEGIVVLEALASKNNIVLRDIPVFDDWLEDKKDVYKGNNNDEFIQLIKGIMNHELPDLKENGYQVARQRELLIIGKELLKIYHQVMNL